MLDLFWCFCQNTFPASISNNQHQDDILIWGGTLLGTNVSPEKSYFEDDFPNFPRWDMLVPYFKQIQFFYSEKIQWDWYI